VFHALHEVIPAVLAVLKLTIDGFGRVFRPANVLHQLSSKVIQLVKVLYHYVHVSLNRLYTLITFGHHQLSDVTPVLSLE